jgi:uncharacterized protein YeaO (DUF488 family)
VCSYLKESVSNAIGRGMAEVRLKRVYDDASPDDGTRVLVDRLWPRGRSREAAKVDLWLKDVAPSDKLRHWFNHDPERWPEFRKRYRAELAERSEDTKSEDMKSEDSKSEDTKSKELETLRRLAAGNKPVTLLFAAKDSEHNNAVVLREWLSARGHGSPGVKKKIATSRRSGAQLQRARTIKHS